MPKSQYGDYDYSAMYAARSFGGGKSSVAKGGNGRSLLTGGAREGARDAGTKRFDLSGRSLNRGGRRV